MQRKFKVLVWVVVLPVKILRVKWQNVMLKKQNKMWQQSRIPLAPWHIALVQKNAYQ